MHRRQFISLAGGAMVVLRPAATRGQPSTKPVIGLLSGTNREPRLIGAIWKGLN